MFLEEKRIPYKIGKVTMFCYGEKEAWYLKKMPSGMLPTLELDGQMVTDSDYILEVLESQFGPLGAPLSSIKPLRQLERNLFRAWCQWCCYPARSDTYQHLMKDSPTVRRRRRRRDMAVVEHLLNEESRLPLFEVLQTRLMAEGTVSPAEDGRTAERHLSGCGS